MHPTALMNAKLFFDNYVMSLDNPTIVDLGAMDVNGSIKSVVPTHARYVGVDLVPGRGVDIVIDDPYSLPFQTESVDVIVSSSCFEHSEFFWVLFLEIMRVLKRGGLFYLNVPSNGPFHKYPVDCWRFYPDSGNALVNWSIKNNIDALLLESYVFNQHGDIWNDYVCVILKDKSYVNKHNNRIINNTHFISNGISYPDYKMIANYQEATEDMRLLQISPRIVRFAVKLNFFLRRIRNTFFQVRKEINTTK